jgi:hypothetical protein
MKKNIVVFEDGKGARGSRAKLIKRGHHSVLIEFTYYDYDLYDYITVTEWFKVYTKYGGEKHNNKRKQASYCHARSNVFYSDYYQTDEYKAEMKKYFTEEYYKELFGEDV